VTWWAHSLCWATRAEEFLASDGDSARAQQRDGALSNPSVERVSDVAARHPEGGERRETAEPADLAGETAMI
jgi:hypothetical protein